MTASVVSLTLRKALTASVVSLTLGKALTASVVSLTLGKALTASCITYPEESIDGLHQTSVFPIRLVLQFLVPQLFPASKQALENEHGVNEPAITFTSLKKSVTAQEFIF